VKLTSKQLRTIIKEELQKTLLSELFNDSSQTYKWNTSKKGKETYYVFTADPKGGTTSVPKLNYSVIFSESEFDKETSYDVAFGIIQENDPSNIETMELTGKHDFKALATIIAAIGDFLKHAKINPARKVKLPAPEGEPVIKLGRKDKYKITPPNIILTFEPTDPKRTRLYLKLISRKLDLPRSAVEQVKSDYDGEENFYILRIPMGNKK